VSTQTQSTQPEPSSARGSALATNEADLWVKFYQRIDDPVIASILAAKLESDPEARRAHGVTYAC
jgi:hypothetical protein